MLEKILQKPEKYRNRLSLSLSLVASLLIFVSFGFYKGYLSLGNLAGAKPASQTASAISAGKMPSPVENSKRAFGEAFSEIGEQYKELKGTVSAVLVPFVTGIEVYERK